MHLKRIGKSIRDKVVAFVLIGLAVVGGIMTFTHQQNKINDLQYQLNIKHQVEERASDYTISS